MPFHTTSHSQVPHFVVAMLECTAYGAYAVLFGFAVWVLPRKFNVLAVKMFFFPAIIALFFSATLNVAFGLMAEMKFVLVPDRPFEMIIPRAVSIQLTFIFSDILGDMILLYRVYAVWGFRKKVIFPLLSMLVVSKVFELFAVTAIIRAFAVPKKPICSRAQIELFTMTFEFMNAFANILMSLMIAGRVWWITRSCSLERRWFRRTVAIVIESGVIYPLYFIITGSIISSSLEVPSPATLGVIVMGLGPTLIAARVGLGSAYDHQTWRTTQSSDVVLSTDIESHHPNPESTSEPQYALRRTAVVSSKSASEDLNSALAK